MKTQHSLQSNAAQRGVALVIVLSMLVLMSAVLVAFMGSVSTERAAQRAAYSSFEAQQAAESAVNLVISQIRQATSNDDGSVGWASQPGAIRTFGTGPGGGMVYKLYSAANMQETEGDYEPDTEEESGINMGRPGEAPPGFVDINQPVFTPGIAAGSVEPHYPIVDPRAGLPKPGVSSSKPGQGRVEGFWTPQNILHASGKKDGENNPIMEVPMRVRWIYQLKDGTMIAADAKSQRIPGAEKDNPPVARVAFWTDDESSKLNINTAGENTYWDTPMASAYDESGNAVSKDLIFTDKKNPAASLAASQPTQGEYQRYPGHPATTNLSPALRWLYPETPDAPNDWQFKEALYRLLPRLRGGGGTSMGGTKANDDKDLGTKDFRIPKRDRLFASLDEFWFRPDRSPISDKGFFGVFREESTALIVDPSTTDITVSPQAIEQLQFFLTAHSRSPDLNMFGHPRVSIWPVHEIDDPIPTKSKRSGFDDLMAFTSSVSKKAYYFTRKDPWSPTYDLMESGPTPVHPLPGQPGRNKKLLFAIGGGSEGYLQRMGRKPIPGVGQSIASKYNSSSGGYTEYERILLSIFDYIRSTNLIDTGRKDSGSAADVYKLAYTPGYSNNPDQKARYQRNSKSFVGSGQVVPSVVYAGADPVMKGFGRFVNVSELALLFYRDETMLPGDDPVPAEFTDPTVTPKKVAGIHYMGIRCVLLPEMWTVSPGYTALSEGFGLRVSEVTPLKVSDPKNPAYADQFLRLADNDFNFVNVNPWRLADGRFFQPTRGFQNQFVYDSNGGALLPKTLSKPNKATSGVPAYQKYPFYSKRFYVVAPPGQTLADTFTFEGGELQVEVFPFAIPPGEAAGQSQNPGWESQLSDKVVQRMTVRFPQAELKVPEAGVQNAAAPRFQQRLSPPKTGASGETDPQKRGFGLVERTDIVRSVEANGPKAKGDLRHIAGIADIPKAAATEYFDVSGVAGAYLDKNRLQVHNFRNSWGRIWENAADNSGPQFALLTPGSKRRGDKINKVPARNGQALLPDGTIGDYDRGFSKHSDGPFINKPDEGNTRFKLPSETDGGHLPYFRGGDGYEEVGQTYFSPNRLVSSAVMFGSLPSGIFAGRPWETLMFCPPTTTAHIGAKSPADHYLLDFFHMPTVEPYAISEPLSTMGKVNLNSRLAPFGYVKMGDRSYIQRHTGLYGIFKGMKQFLLDGGSTAANDAGHREGPLNVMNQKYRYEIDPELMMTEIIDPYLDKKKYFRYASEVCDLDLPMKGMQVVDNVTSRKGFWTQYQMTGDNARERPYSHIYPRVTTKSNVYTVHVWAQSIAKNPSTKKDDWDLFDDTKDRVLGEYRGSTTIERYIDVDDKALENYDIVENPNERGLDPFYRFRIVNQKRFTPN